MNVCVRLFAIAKQLAGTGSVELHLPEGATIGDLRRRLVVDVPGLAQIVDQMLFAVDAEYAHDRTPLTAASEVACIPPVSGG